MASFVEVGGHAGDEGNFEALYETYKHDVQRLASYLLKNATDAEDAAQTVFMNVLRALRQGVTPADPRAWLLAITRNVCFSRGRAAATRPDYVELDFDAPSEPSDDQTPSADEIVGALTRMRPNQRTALILRDFRGVSRSEISHLMSLSAVSVEALLTRARASFRGELEAGDQPFVCEETRKLVEQQLDGHITVADRHSLRTHLRHCSPCSTLARALRSSRSKAAGLLLWPTELVSRLVSAFSQASSVAHVAAAVTSTAAVATVAIPVAISNGPTAAHVEGRTAPAAAVASHPAAPHAVAPGRPAPAAAPVATRADAPAHHAVRTHKATHTRVHATRHAAPKRASARPATTAVAATRPATAQPAAPSAPAPPASAPTVQAPAHSAFARPVAVHAAPQSVPPATTFRRPAPPARFTAKPHTGPAAKHGRKSTKRHASEHRFTGPPETSVPVATLPSAGAPSTGPPGVTPAAVAEPAAVLVTPSTGASDSSSDSGKSHKHHK